MYKIEDHIKELEVKLLHSDFRENPEMLNELLCEDFEEIGSIGKTSSRDAAVHWLLTKEKGLKWTLDEFRVRKLSSDLVLAIYRARIKGNLNTHSPGSIRSSIWKLYDGKWKMTFHQGTKVVEM